MVESGFFTRIRKAIHELWADAGQYRNKVFAALLLISAAGTVNVLLGGQDVFVRQEYLPFVRLTMAIWLPAQVLLFLLAKRGRSAVAYNLFSYVCFALLVLVFNTLTIPPLCRSALMVAYHHTLVFVAILLMGKGSFLVFATLTDVVLVANVAMALGRVTRPEMPYVLAGFAVPIVSQWVMTVTSSSWMHYYVRMLTESRSQLAERNEELEAEVASFVS